MPNASKDQILPGTEFFGARLSTGTGPSPMLKRAAFVEKRIKGRGSPWIMPKQIVWTSPFVSRACLLEKYFLPVLSGEKRAILALCLRTLYSLSASVGGIEVDTAVSYVVSLEILITTILLCFFFLSFFFFFFFFFFFSKDLLFLVHRARKTSLNLRVKSIKLYISQGKSYFYIRRVYFCLFQSKLLNTNSNYFVLELFGTHLSFHLPNSVSSSNSLT